MVLRFIFPPGTTIQLATARSPKHHIITSNVDCHISACMPFTHTWISIPLDVRESIPYSREQSHQHMSPTSFVPILHQRRREKSSNEAALHHTIAYEMRTLARIYQPILPFCRASESIPSEDEIYNYTFYLHNHEKDEFNSAVSACLALILWDQHLILDIGDAGCRICPKRHTSPSRL